MDTENLVGKQARFHYASALSVALFPILFSSLLWVYWMILVPLKCCKKLSCGHYENLTMSDPVPNVIHKWISQRKLKRTQLSMNKKQLAASSGSAAAEKTCESDAIESLPNLNALLSELELSPYEDAFTHHGIHSTEQLMKNVDENMLMKISMPSVQQIPLLDKIKEMKEPFGSSQRQDTLNIQVDKSTSQHARTNSRSVKAILKREKSRGSLMLEKGHENAKKRRELVVKMILQDDQVKTRDVWYYSCVLFLYMLYPSLCRFPMEMMSCKILHPDVSDHTSEWTTRAYLRYDAEELCFGNHHLYYTWLIAIPSLLGYSLGLPVYTLVLLWRQSKLHRSKKYLFRMGLLYSGYAKDRWWWEGVVAVRKLSIIFFANFFYDSTIQLPLALGLMLFTFAAHHIYEPFGSDGDVSATCADLDRLERNSILVCNLLLWSATIFIVSGTCEHGFCYLLALVSIFANVWFLCSGVYFYFRYWTKKNKTTINNLFNRALKSKVTAFLLSKKRHEVVNPMVNLKSRRAHSRKKKSHTKSEGSQKVDVVELTNFTNTNVTAPDSQMSYYQYVSEDGEVYFISEDGEPVWDVPENAEIIVVNSQDGYGDGKRYARFVSEGVEYYVSEDGSEALWELPEGAYLMDSHQDLGAEGADTTWVKMHSEEGHIYYISEQGECSWSLPRGARVVEQEY